MTMTMTVDRSGTWPQFDWEAAAGLWAEKAAPLGQSMLRAHAPFRTGALRASIDEQTVVSPGLATIMFYSQIDYMKYVLGGTVAHTITARNARALRWIANSGHGPTRFARFVRHPGTKPNDFPEAAIGLIGPAVSQMFADSVKESLEL